jgi:hypothetical protein
VTSKRDGRYCSLRDDSKIEIRVCVSIRVSVGVRCEVRVRVRFSIVASDWLLILLGKDLPKMIMFCDWLSETNQKQK